MFAITSIRRTTRLIKILSTVGTGMILTGCGGSSGNAEDIISELLTIPPAETETSDSNIDAPVGPAFLDAEPPVTVEPENEVIVFEPPAEEPEPPVLEPPVTDETGNEVIVFEPPAEEPEPPVLNPPLTELEEPPIIDETPEVSLGDASVNAIALQRLQPFTRYDYTNFEDGAMFFAAFLFSEAELVDDGENSSLTLELENSRLTCGFLSELGAYICIDLFADNGTAFLDLFTLNANNTGNGTYSICADFELNVEGCLTELIATPQGSSVVTAGIQTAFAINDVRSGNEYLDFLAQSEPASTPLAANNAPEIVEIAQRLVNQTISQ